MPPRRRPDVVGNGNDISTQAPKGLFISTATGSFDSVTGLTSVSSPIGNSGKPVTDAYTLQLNTNTFSSTACAKYGSPNPACQGWEQFVFFNDGTSGSLYIQYWLLDFNATCPAGGWTQFSFTGSTNIFCFRNSDAAAVPNQPITNLGQLSLSGPIDAAVDSAILSSGSTLHSVVGDNSVNAAAGWQLSEFNVFGAGGDSSGGGQASFNSGAAFVVRTRVTYGDSGGPAILTTTPNMVAVSGHYSNGDQRHVVIVGTTGGKIHEIFWKSDTVGIEGQDDLPSVSFNPNTIAAVSGFYNSDDQRHVVVVGTTGGKIHEIFWKSDTVGIEGQDDLPSVSFNQNTIAAVSGFYNSDDQRHVVVVGTTGGKIHEIFWKSDTVGIEGQDDLPSVSFNQNTIAAVSGFYNSDDHRHVVVVGTTGGKIHEIFWKSDTVGIEGQDDLPSVSFNQNAIKGIAGFYNSSDQHHVVIVGTTDGKVYRITWKATTVGIENQSLIAQFDANSIVGVGGFYSEHDRFEHVIVGTNDGKLYELWARSETAAPICVAEGFTGETSNLSFGSSAPAASQPGPALLFTESSAGGSPSNCAAATAVAD